jgi:hypothetical protein
MHIMFCVCFLLYIDANCVCNHLQPHTGGLTYAIDRLPLHFPCLIQANILETFPTSFIHCADFTLAQRSFQSAIIDSAHLTRTDLASKSQLQWELTHSGHRPEPIELPVMRSHQLLFSHV